jgi:hypothetical protein
MLMENDLLQQTGGVSLKEAAEVIANGHPPIADGVFLIDFDGTIAPFGHLFNYPEPFPGIANFTKRLKSRGYQIGIFTSRLSPVWLETVPSTAEQHVAYIQEYCDKHGILYDFITADKRPGMAYVDDKAIEFKGDWREMIIEFTKRGWI